MKLLSSAATLALSVASAAVLVACGGGGGSSETPQQPAGITISGVAADGALQGATACYDLNDNGVCDSGEPTGTTDANGNFSFDVAAAEVGKHRVVVDVPASAIDKDTGEAVGNHFALQSPATGTATAHTVFASPLTTLVQAQVDSTGASVSIASDYIKTQAGLAVSPLLDYTQSSAADAKLAATLARLVAITEQAQGAAVASVVGQVDLSGKAVTAADIDKAVMDAVLGALPAMAAALQEPAVTGAATPTDLRAALASAAQAIVTQQSGLTSATALTVIGLSKMPPDTSASTPSAGATLRALRYTGPDDWYYRAMEASAADNTPDSSGMVHFYDVHQDSTIDVFGKPQMRSWAFSNDKNRTGDLHWSGSAWVSCPLGYRSVSSPRDVQGRSSYNYCDHFEDGTSTRSAVDVSNKSIRDVVVNTVRTFPGGDSGVAYANFGPSDLNLLGSATFPANSTLWYFNNRALSTAYGYDPRDVNVVMPYTAAVAAGGDARTGSPACSSVTAANSATFQSPATTLEDLATRNPGKPCVFNKNTNADGSSLDPNEWWGDSTASMGVVNGAQTQPSGTANYYTTNAALRVGFAASGNGTTYFSCLQRADGSPRNCSVIGSGSYAIETLGDARVMSFSGLPAITQRTGFSRVFVQRGGKVYYGYRNVVGDKAPMLRFNLAAGNAILAQLGLQPMAPIPPASAADTAKANLFATAKGVWQFATAGSTVVRFGDGGRYLHVQSITSGAGEQPGLELGTMDIDPATGSFNELIDVDTDLQSGVSNHGSSQLTVTASQITSTDGGSLTRLTDDPSGIVGLWARNSATDLNTQHLLFEASGRVTMVDPLGETDSTSVCYSANQGPPGIEVASYTFDAGTGALHVFNKQIDTNGCAGLFDSSQGAISGGTANTTFDATAIFSSDKKTLTAGGDTWYRIAPQ